MSKAKLDAKGQREIVDSLYRLSGHYAAMGMKDHLKKVDNLILVAEQALPLQSGADWFREYVGTHEISVANMHDKVPIMLDGYAAYCLAHRTKSDADYLAVYLWEGKFKSRLAMATFIENLLTDRADDVEDVEAVGEEEDGDEEEEVFEEDEEEEDDDIEEEEEEQPKLPMTMARNLRHGKK